MKNFKCLLIIIIVGMAGSSLGWSQVSTENIEEINGLYYEIGKKNAFTGTAITYYENGQLETSMEVVDGKLNGEMSSWYEDGTQLAKGNMKDGIQSGEWIAWYENGSKIRQGNYLEGREHGMHSWWTEDGVLIKRGSYSKGLTDGLWEWYYDNGQKKQEGTLRGEVHDGVWKDWYEDGSQKTVANFILGVKDGEWIWWENDGSISTRKVYEFGELVEGEKDLDYYIELMERDVQRRDFNNALSHIEQAIASQEDQSESNAVYMGLLAYHAGVYAYFQRLDDAERIILEGVGLTEEHATTIVESTRAEDEEKLRALATHLEASNQATTTAGPQVALAFIYNILGDSIRLQEKQQLSMERAGLNDWVLQLSMALYRYRGEKENTDAILKEIRDEIAVQGATRDNQFELAWYLFIAGNFSKAIEIADTYLAENEKDIDFLYIKMNTAMAHGRVEEMEIYEAKILDLDPSAFD